MPKDISKWLYVSTLFSSNLIPPIVAAAVSDVLAWTLEWGRAEGLQGPRELIGGVLVTSGWDTTL